MVHDTNCFKQTAEFIYREDYMMLIELTYWEENVQDVCGMCFVGVHNDKSDIDCKHKGLQQDLCFPMVTICSKITKPPSYLGDTELFPGTLS